MEVYDVNDQVLKYISDKNRMLAKEILNIIPIGSTELYTRFPTQKKMVRSTINELCESGLVREVGDLTDMRRFKLVSA